MFRIQAEKQTLKVLEREALTEGAVGVYPVQCTLSEDWDGMTVTAIFRRGQTARAAAVTDGACEIPWEVLAKPEAPEKPKRQGYDWDLDMQGRGAAHLEMGLVGLAGVDTVYPTGWANLGAVRPAPALDTAANAADPTPSLYAQYVAEVETAKQGAEDAAKEAAEQTAAAKEAAEAAQEAADSAKENAESAGNAAESAAKALQTLLTADFTLTDAGHLYLTIETEEDGEA